MSNVVIGAKVNVDVKDSTKNIEDLKKEIDDLRSSLSSLDQSSQEYADTVKKLNDAESKLQTQTNSLNKSLDKTTDSSKKSGGSFSKLGGSLKALGIVALVSKAWEGLKSAFEGNSESAGVLGAIMQTISTVFTTIVGIITKVVNKVSESSNGFEGLTGVLKGLVGILGGVLKGAFAGIALIIQEAQLAWENSFFGDGDPETIKKLEESIEGSKKSLKEAGELALESGKMVVTNLGKAVDEIGKVVISTVDEVQKIDSTFIKSTYDQAKALEILKRNATIAQAKLAGLKAEAERNAEQLRQERDQQNLSIEERIAANEKLKGVLEEVKKASLAEADVLIQKAELEFKLNKGNRELEAKIIDAKTQRKDIEAQITGQFSEQMMNAQALTAELKARDKAASESSNQLLLQQKKANAELVTDELKKNQQLQEIRDEERKIELQRLQGLIDSANAGTQARVDAEIAFNTKKQELDAADEVAKKEREKIERERLLAQQTAQGENTLAEIALRKQANEAARIDSLTKAENAIAIAKLEAEEVIKQLHLKRDAEIAAAEAAGLSTTEIKNKYAIQEMAINQQLAQSEQALAKAKIDAALETADALSSTLGNIKALFGEQSKAGKAAAIAQATIDTFASAVRAYNATVGIPFVGPVLAPVNAGLAVAAGIANIKKIAAVQIPGGGGAAPVPTVSGGGAAPMSPTVSPAIQGQALNAEAINNMGNQSLRAYVMNSDIQNNDQRNAYLERNARIG